MAKKDEIRFDAVAKQQYCALLAQTGLKQKSAREIGFNPCTINAHEKTDPEFKAAVDEAMEDYRELLEAEIKRRAVDGVQSPVYNKNGDLVGHKLEYSDRMLELHAKRHIAAYRDKQTIDHNIKGGVMVVPGTALTSQEWEDHGGSAVDAAGN